MKAFVIGGLILLVIITLLMVYVCIKYDDRPLTDEEAKEQWDYLNEWRRRNG